MSPHAKYDPPAAKPAERQEGHVAAKIVGIGWAKTGTTSLGEALRTLGFDHQGPRLDLVEAWMEGNLQSARRLASTKESFEDWPWLLLYEEFDDWFPGSKFILTERNADRWLASHRKMTDRQATPSERLLAIRRFVYGLPFPGATDDQMVERYERHNAAVKSFFADRPGDLLVVDWERGDGWDALCSFLGRPVPEGPFPHLNRAPEA